MSTRNGSSTSAIAVQRPANLAIVAFDNERYGETDMQATHTAHGVDLAAVACGFRLTGTLRDKHEVEAALPAIRSAPGPILYVAKARAEPLPFALPPKEGPVPQGPLPPRAAGGSGGVTAS